MDRKFVLLCTEQIVKLLQVLESRLPKSAMIFNITRLYLDNRYSENVQAKFYAFEGNLNANEGFFLVAQYRKCYENQCVVISAPNDPTSEMVKNFENTINWSVPIAFAATDVKFSAFVQQMCKHQGILQVIDPCSLLTMTVPQALALSTPATPGTVVLRELGEETAEIATKRWQFSSEGTLEFIRDSIKTVASAGVFVNSEPACWVIGASIGSINALYTEEAHRRKGYAEITMKLCCKLFGERGLIPNVQVQLDNKASKGLMQKVGLQFSHDVDWIIYRPPLT